MVIYTNVAIVECYEASLGKSFWSANVVGKDGSCFWGGVDVYDETSRDTFYRNISRGIGCGIERILSKVFKVIAKEFVGLGVLLECKVFEVLVVEFAL